MGRGSEPEQTAPQATSLALRNEAKQGEVDTP